MQYSLGCAILKGNRRFKADVTYLLETGLSSLGFFPCEGKYNNTVVTKNAIKLFIEEYNSFVLNLLNEQDNDTLRKFTTIKSPLHALHNRIKLKKHCGSGQNVLAITPNLDVYPCSPFVGNKSFHIGNIHNQGADLFKNICAFSMPKVCEKSACQSCWAKYLCAGGCYFSAYSTSDNPCNPNPLRCLITKNYVETALMIYASLYETETV